MARFTLLLLLALMVAPVWSGGSSYGVSPGSRDISGRVTEWPVPTPRFARDPAPGPDGNIYIAVMQGDRIARFDTKTHNFREWTLPAGTQPHGLLVAPDGKVLYTGNGNGTIGELDPASGNVREFKTPSGRGGPHTLVFDADGNVWFTGQSGGYVAKLERTSGKITEHAMGGGPYGLTLDRQGIVWVCRMNVDKLGRLDPRSGKISELYMGPGSQPRRIATAPDGTLWVTLYGNGKLAKVDPVAGKVQSEFEMPAGPNGGPYAVTVDGRGRVWANEIQTDTVSMLDPHTEKFRVFKLPSRNVGIRKAIVDAEGRYWYMGSHNGRLGVLE